MTSVLPPDCADFSPASSLVASPSTFDKWIDLGLFIYFGLMSLSTLYRSYHDG